MTIPRCSPGTDAVPGPMHWLVIGPRKAVTSCGLRMSAHYPMSKTGLTAAGDEINCAVAPDSDGVRVTCPYCLKKVGRA